ncbi:hypothetical protein [Campylobacter sp.]|nr:hypothetical protein [Campylobacter sp.]
MYMRFENSVKGVDMDNEKIMKKLRAMLLKDKKLKEILKEYL